MCKEFNISMANAINLHELEQELTRTKHMFEQWSRIIVTSAEECKAAHLSKMRAGKGDTVQTQLQLLVRLLTSNTHMRNVMPLQPSLML